MSMSIGGATVALVESKWSGMNCEAYPSRLALVLAVIDNGGISLADKAAQVANTDRVTPQFSIGMEDNYIPLPEIQDTSQGGDTTNNSGISESF